MAVHNIPGKGTQARIKAAGVLKGNGSGKVEVAEPGTDYQAPTQGLPTFSNMTLNDTLPFYSATEAANKKITLQKLKDALGVQSPTIAVTACTGAVVTCTDGETTLTGSGSSTFTLPNIGTWTVTATLGGTSVDETVEVAGAIQYNVDLVITSSVAITSPPTKTIYSVGESFDPTGLVVTATNADNTTEDVTEHCTYAPATMAAGTTSVTITYQRAGITKTTTQAVTVRVLSSIAVTTAPTKKSYFIGEYFNSAGTVITATMSDGSTKTVNGWSYSPTTALTASSTTITYSYTENGVTKTCTYGITIKTLRSIAVTTAPSKTTYNYGEQFSSAGMVITATYTDNSTRTVAGWTFSPTTNLTLNDTTITISYTENGVTKTCTQTIVVNNSLSSIAVTTNPTKMNYLAGELFSTAGMVVRATFADGSTQNVTGYTYSPTTALSTATTTITISYTYNGVTKTTTLTITVIAVSSTLNSNDWSTIQTVARASSGANYWSVGDAKQVALSGTVGCLTLSSSYYAYIIGFNHNQSVEGIGIHFQFGKTAATGGVDIAFCDSQHNTTGSSAAFRMNTTNTNSGGWKNSYMRGTIIPAFKNAMPTALRNVLAATTKYSDNTGGGSDTASYVNSTSDEIFLLAEWEVHGARTYANSAEKNYQQQYAYYANGNSKIKYKHAETATACIWWLRSVNATNATRFCGVRTGGGATADSAYSSLGFAPGFKVA